MTAFIFKILKILSNMAFAEAINKQSEIPINS